MRLTNNTSTMFGTCLLVSLATSFILLPMASSAAADSNNAKSAPRNHRKLPRIGPEIGVFLPTDGTTRNRFGASWLSVGLGFSALPHASAKGQIGVNVKILRGSHDGNTAYVIPIGLGYRRALQVSGTTVTYAGATTDVYFSDMNSPDDNIKWGIRNGYGASVLTGVTFGETGYIQAEYHAVTKIRNLNFSGLELQAGLRF